MDLIRIPRKLFSLVQKYRYVLLVLLIGVGLMLLPDLNKEDESDGVTINESDSYDQTQALTEILSQIDGVGKVSIMLTWETGEEYIYQTDASGSAEQWDTVTITDQDRAEQGLIQKTIAPKYRGAIVVCEGAENVAVRLSVIEAVSDATGLSTDRISVLKMK